MMDHYDMWKDTMLIVNTDHGFMLGEKEWMGKNVQPMYNEIVHSPFFIYDPRNPVCGERRNSLAQTVDIVPTLAEYFGVEPPVAPDGSSLTPIVKSDETIREYALFGIFGGHVCVTDGRYVYMRSCMTKENKPLNEYTLMPNHMRGPFSIEEMAKAEMIEGFPFMRGSRVMKIPAEVYNNPGRYGTLLFDLETDPEEKEPIRDREVELRLMKAMRDLMVKNQAPEEQFVRIGIPMEGEITEEFLDNREPLL